MFSLSDDAGANFTLEQVAFTLEKPHCVCLLRRLSASKKEQKAICASVSQLPCAESQDDATVACRGFAHATHHVPEVLSNLDFCSCSCHVCPLTSGECPWSQVLCLVDFLEAHHVLTLSYQLSSVVTHKNAPLKTHNHFR